jgi:hypothetical protein
VSLPAAEVARLRRRAFGLEYATMTWMVAEAAIAITCLTAGAVDIDDDSGARQPGGRTVA